MAAYAALVSLMNTMDHILNHPCHSTSFDKKQIQSLGESLDFLLDFMESYNSQAEYLERQIASAAHEAEDVIESHVVDRILARSTIEHGETSSGFMKKLTKAIKKRAVKVEEKIFKFDRSPHFLPDLQKAIDDMDSIKEKVMEVKEKIGAKAQLSIYHSMPRSFGAFTNGTAMVEFDEELIQLMDMLTQPESSRQIISIVGMGGMGKTTLARNTYEHLVIRQHFDVCLWATVSQFYGVEEILFELLLRKSTFETVHELGEQLHKALSGKRYLIILDDMWNTKAWDEVQLFFPNNNNGSRVVVTTRISNAVVDLRSSIFTMNFLDDDKSWKLFCEKAFGGEDCPPKIEEIGKQIVKKCRGLPLLIVVIGGHFGKSSRTKEHWEKVANDMNSFLTSEEDRLCLNILSLSYNYLPVYLKPCFLYMGVFPEDERIFACDLINLWVAEGFLKPSKIQSLEEVAEGYIKDLVGMNLILVRTWTINGKIETCSIHDLLRELCLKVAKEEKFFHVLDASIAIHGERCVVIHERESNSGAKDHCKVFQALKSAPRPIHSFPGEKHRPKVFDALIWSPLIRSLKCQGGDLLSDGCLKFEGGELLIDLRLLRVLNWVHGMPYDICECRFKAHFRQVNLRYLDWSNFVLVCHPPCQFLHLPSSISLLWNLQTLILRGASVQIIAPSEIWEMTQLRHMELEKMIHLPNPLPSERLDQFVLQNLRTLLVVKNLKLSEDVCKRIPCVNRLKLWYGNFACEGATTSSRYCPDNLYSFHKLESLECEFSIETDWRDFVLDLTFPSSLRELSLRNCRLQWDDVTMIGLSLPNLEVLKLSRAGGQSWGLNGTL